MVEPSRKDTVGKSVGTKILYNIPMPTIVLLCVRHKMSRLGPFVYY